VDVGRILAAGAAYLPAGAAYLPAELLVAGLALALFGLWPRALPVAWATVAFVAFIAFLGPGLRLPSWMLDLSPTTHVGNPPLAPSKVCRSSSSARSRGPRRRRGHGLPSSRGAAALSQASAGGSSTRGE
jgi:hypothetical protein